ncbi:hypothetical protein E3J79_01805 [Candidatus Dependentiae bacterium]|nr:MAG: hypothetical protein E3J79_01805 [Candidatus Dependentiae bacterium]
MYLLQSWKESLLIFKPTNFKLFFLVTVKSIWETYKILFRYFWWLILVLLTVPFHRTALGLLIMYMGPLLFTYIVVLIVRSSVSLKNWGYFGKYILSYYIIPFLVIVLAFFSYYSRILFNRPSGLTPFISFSQIITFVFSVPIQYILSDLSRFNQVELSIFFQLLISPFVVLFTLFYLDSDKGFRSIMLSLIRSIKMIIFNYPAYFIMYSVIFLFLNLFWNILFKYLFVELAWNICFYSTIFLIPIPICIFTNLYIKQVHEQFSLYFGGKPSEK